MPYSTQTVITITTPTNKGGVPHDSNVNMKINELETMGMEICNTSLAIGFPDQQQMFLATTIFYEPKEAAGDPE